MTLLAILSSTCCSILGTLSAHLDASPAGWIVVLQTLLFIITMIFAPKYGLLARR